jgi:hypothetical protein
MGCVGRDTMTIPDVVLLFAVICLLWASASVVFITAELRKRGVETPWPLMRLYSLRNVHRYRELTIAESGKPGRLFFAFVYPINAAWILILLWLIFR